MTISPELDAPVDPTEGDIRGGGAYWFDDDGNKYCERLEIYANGIWVPMANYRGEKLEEK